MMVIIGKLGNSSKFYPLSQMAVCQNLVPLVNIKIAGKWMFIPLKMVLIGIDPYPNMSKQNNSENTPKPPEPASVSALHWWNCHCSLPNNRGPVGGAVSVPSAVSAFASGVGGAAGPKAKERLRQEAERASSAKARSLRRNFMAELVKKEKATILRYWMVLRTVYTMYTLRTACIYL